MIPSLEPIRALVELARSYYKDGVPQPYEVANAAVLAAGPISQLLEAVTNLEKLEAEWREHGGNPTNGYEVAGSIKRLLHPEDK